ncbi:restriction endonuclease subunit S [Micrococcus lylae]|uniref:restriction endonuclease subunit S n=1 Tax=Micrococcus lylae TaxID=1273 RepID=UPI003EB78833
MTFERVRLGSLAEVTVSNVDKHSVDGQPIVRLCNYTDVYYQHALDQSREYMVATASPDQIQKFRLQVDDVVITKDSETADDIGIPALITETADDFVCGYHLAILRPNPQKTDGRYLNWVLQSDDLKAQFENIAFGVTRVGLKTGRIKTLEIPVPGGQSVQARVADYLDRETATIDALIEKQRRLLVVLLERRREAIRAAVFGSNEACLNADPLEALPEGWRRAKLRHVATMHTGHTPSRSKPEYWEDTSIPWFTLADVWQLRPGTRKYLGETKSRISPLGLENSAAELLPKGTVVLSRTASVGFTGIMPRAMATSQDYWNWVCGPQLCPEFLWNVFRAMKSDFDSLKAGSTHKTIYQADAAALQIPLPPVQTQQAIVDHLDAETAKIDTLIAKAERFIELAQERRAALITAAVTGQIEIPT